MVNRVMISRVSGQCWPTIAVSGMYQTREVNSSGAIVVLVLYSEWIFYKIYTYLHVSGW